MLERVNYDKCPLCFSKDFKEYFIANCEKHISYNNKLSKKIVWNQCNNCSHIYTEGYFTNESLKIIFSSTQDNQVAGADLEVNRIISSKIINKIVPYQKNGIWLDVGFGNGSLIFTADEYGFQTIGLDLREENVNTLIKLGFETYKNEICNFKHDKLVSVISMADVLEHTNYPVNALKSAKRLLKKNGVLFLSMPNSDQISWKIATEQNKNPYWGELEHYHNFSRKRMYELLIAHNFTPINYSISERYRMCMEIIAIAN